MKEPVVKVISGALDGAERRLDKLEGALALEGDEQDVAWMFEEDSDVESRVHCSLKEHYDFWVQTGVILMQMCINSGKTRRKKTYLYQNMWYLYQQYIQPQRHLMRLQKQLHLLKTFSLYEMQRQRYKLVLVLEHPLFHWIHLKTVVVKAIL